MAVRGGGYGELYGLEIVSVVVVSDGRYGELYGLEMVSGVAGGG